MKKKPKPLILKLETPDFKIRFDVTKIITKAENLKLAGIKTADIAGIRPAFFKISDSWYTELNVAKPYHPTPGSLGFECLTNSGDTCSFQLIPYYDFNPKQDHCKGIRHWNNGGRIVDASGKAHLVRELKGVMHTIKKDYPWIKWTMLPGPDGKPKSVEIHRPKKPVT